jgi:hypothetical protein
MVFTPRTCCVDATAARAVGLAEALMAETKVRRAGALSCLVNGERRALEKVREAIAMIERSGVVLWEMMCWFIFI